MDIGDLAKTLSAVMEPFYSIKASIQNSIAPALLSFARATKQITESAQTNFEKIRPVILSTVQGLTTLSQIYDTAEKLGKRQFILVSHIPNELVERALAGEDVERLASEYLTTDELIQRTAQYCGLQDSLLLQQTIKALYDGSYNLAMLGLMAYLDRVLSEQSGMIKKINFRLRYETIYRKINEQGELYLDEMEGKDFLVFLTYNEAIDGIGDDEGFDKEEPQEVNRNWLMHGRTDKVYTRLDCVKVLNMIYGTIRLGELGKADAIEGGSNTLVQFKEG